MSKLLFLLITMIVLLSGSGLAAQDGTGEDEMSHDDVIIGDPRVPAPDFPAGLDWLNVPAPVSFEALRGKVVVLDFWTYGCINCIHMIPVLEQLEAKYPDELVVIGVHSAKFAAEGQTENLRQIVQRYDLHHPVINDSAFTVWQTWGAQGWPSFAFVDPLGNVVIVQGRDGQPAATLAGELPFEVFDRVVGGMVRYFDEQGQINREPLELALEADASPNTPLNFPGKVLADPAGNRLFITDTNHHRIVIADLTTYEVLDIVGSGGRGLADGAFAEARFNKPQGLTLDGSTLYVADTNNHAIRAVDLTGRTVSTIAGTGEQSRTRNQSGDAATTPLASPWDVELGDENLLYIAMAGPHQLWMLDLTANVVLPLVGSGIEGLADGDFSQAQLAQPSGLYYVDNKLYFADSESSSIRVADMTTQQVTTLAGPLENDLFTFGDVDGPVGESRLQHALGVTGDEDGNLYVADTYNSKIKLLNGDTREIRSLYGESGLGGYRDGGADLAEFDEPGGLDYANGKLYVADTNNQVVRVIDLAAGEVSTVTFPNVQALLLEDQPTVIAGNASLGVSITLPEQTVRAGEGSLLLNINLPEGYKLNDLAPFTAEWVTSNEAVIFEEGDQVFSVPEPQLPIRVPVRLAEGADLLHGDLTIYYCEAVNETLCFVDRVSIDAPVTVSADAGEAEIVLAHTIVPPDLGQ